MNKAHKGDVKPRNNQVSSLRICFSPKEKSEGANLFPFVVSMLAGVMGAGMGRATFVATSNGGYRLGYDLFDKISVECFANKVGAASNKLAICLKTSRQQMLTDWKFVQGYIYRLVLACLGPFQLLAQDTL